MKRGFSLVELMIALLIGSLLMAGVFTVLVGAKQSYRVQDELSRTQENARFAAEFIARDLRMAGFRGCRPSLPITPMINAASDWRYDLNTPIRGYQGIANFPVEFDAGATIAAFSNANHDPDALVVVRVDADNTRGVGTETAGNLTLSGAHDFALGQVMAASTCDALTLFQVSADNTGTTTLAHNVVAGLSPGNCSNRLGGDCATPAAGAFDQGGVVMPLVGRAYYLANGVGGVPGLYRVEVGPSGGLTRDELVPGIEDMRIWFGHDSDNDGVVNRWRRAGDPSLDFSEVTAARVQMLLRTLQAPDAEVKPYAFAGAAITPADGHVRRSFVTTINLRNRS
ncbi:prepilin-type N-terminal cleavage/methylation domain-containing protein [Litorivicinus lipolyticus]|uniref:Prepilin-type N-terminal cleavage/methylation domain-containing protein n=1 Tax=Litorivicinus lipolyticus TaxID=418701 RepID=A0A5Q2QFY2_9GAMM|nr:PilW family protein [Litorivicinus lipolyticus]QGG80897.1 prepilin-type N-terminal cleavage/methylation domain-containing protein [Litorivicinus lipolyticus]